MWLAAIQEEVRLNSVLSGSRFEQRNDTVFDSTIEDTLLIQSDASCSLLTTTTCSHSHKVQTLWTLAGWTGPAVCR
jgi:hypothetical protein